MSRADLYATLAEALAEPPEWLAGAGPQWPLFVTVADLAPASEAADRAAHALAAIPAESLAARQARYAALFAGVGRPRLQLYESEAVGGRVFGPEVVAVERYYTAAGLEAVGAELPDHASLELAFLAHTAEHDARAVEREFIAKHAGRWLPTLGRALARSGDEVYAPIGQLLAEWVEECAAHSAPQRPPKPALKHAPRWPVLTQAEACTLCGFCVQVCPTHALTLHETARETALVLSPAKCVGCNKCERVCEMRVLKIQDFRSPQDFGSLLVLRQSPRVLCRGCDVPMVSQAELDFVIRQIGHPAWLDYCSDCRSVLEVSR
jgi:nitrate reductase assembly molybdenum cofactor insertion protein NarJ/ferredoxin-like protein FixX